MPKPTFGLFHQPGGIAQLTRGRGWNSELAGFLLPYAFRDYWFKFFDFDEEDAINANWAVANNAATSDEDFAPNVDVEDGVIIGDTGTDDNGVIGLRYDNALMDAARNPGAEIRMLVDTVTGTNPLVEFAICDPPTGLAVLNITDVDTPSLASNGVTDGGFIIVDDDQTLKAAALLTIGTTDSTIGDNKAILGGSSPGSSPITAATFFTMLLQLGSRRAYAIFDDNLQLTASVNKGPDTAILMAPQLVVGTRVASTAVFPQVDYIAMWKERKGR